MTADAENQVIASQAVLIVTEYPDGRMQLRSFGDGESEEIVDYMVALFREMARSEGVLEK